MNRLIASGLLSFLLLSFCLAQQPECYVEELNAFALSATGRLYAAVRWETAWRILLEAELWVQAGEQLVAPRVSGVHHSLVKSCALWGAVCPRASDMPLLYQKMATIAQEEGLSKPLLVIGLPAPSCVSHSAQQTAFGLPVLYLAGGDVMMRSMAEIDFVMGHELAHVSLHHGRIPLLSLCALTAGILAAGVFAGHCFSSLVRAEKGLPLFAGLASLGVVGAGIVALHAYVLRRREYAADAWGARYAPEGARTYFAPGRPAFYRYVVRPSVVALTSLLKGQRFAMLSEAQRQILLMLLEVECQRFTVNEKSGGLAASHPSEAQRHKKIKSLLEKGTS